MSELKKNGIEFLSNLEGYHQCLKGILIYKNYL